MIPTLVSMAITISHTRMTMSIQLNFFFSIMFASPPCPSPKGEGSEMLFKGLIICLTPDGGIYSPRPLERGQGVRLLEKGGAPPTAAFLFFPVKHRGLAARVHLLSYMGELVAKS